MDKILLAIPCYNCSPQAQRVAKSIDHFITVNSAIPLSEILFIDNCSTDTTVSDLEQLIPHLKNSNFFKIKKNKKNLGLGDPKKRPFTGYLPMTPNSW